MNSILYSCLLVYGWYVLHLLQFFFDDRLYGRKKKLKPFLFTWRQFIRGFIWTMGGSLFLFPCSEQKKEAYWKIVRMSLLYVLTDDEIERNRRYVTDILKDMAKRIRWRITPISAVKYQRLISIEMLALDDRWCNNASLYDVFRKDCLKGVYSADTFFHDNHAPDLARKCGALLQLCDDIADIDEDREMGILTFAGYCGARTTACIVLQYIRDAKFPKIVHNMLISRLWHALTPKEEEM